MRYAALALGLIAGLSGCQKPEITVIDVPKPRPVSAVAFSSKANQSRFHYQLPTGWTETNPGPMHLAQFSIPVDGEVVMVSVTTLGGDAGGLLSNVNRWRGQLGLTPINDDGLTKIKSEISGKRLTFTVVDMVNPGSAKRVIGAVTRTESDTWFVKLEGTSAQLDRVKPQWDAFIRTVEVQ